MKMKDFDDIKSDFKNRNVLGSEEERSFYFLFFLLKLICINLLSD